MRYIYSTPIPFDFLHNALSILMHIYLLLVSTKFGKKIVLTKLPAGGALYILWAQTRKKMWALFISFYFILNVKLLYQALPSPKTSVKWLNNFVVIYRRSSNAHLTGTAFNSRAPVKIQHQDVTFPASSHPLWNRKNTENRAPEV